MKTTFTPRFWLSFVLVIAGVVLRIIPHPWNFAPVGAIALFAGAHFERRTWAIGVPLLTMLAGDAIIGFHSLMPFVYLSYALIALIGIVLRGHRSSVSAIGGGVLISSVVFYLITNFAVWAQGAMYAKTAAGLAACYIAAIPFIGNTLASDAIYTAIFFSVFAVSERQIPLFART
jgi:hypothetical protein